MQQKHVWITIVVIVVLGFLLWNSLSRKTVSLVPPQATTTEEEGVIVIPVSPTTTTVTTKDYTIERVEIAQYPTPVPRLYVSANTNNVPADYAASIQARIRTENEILAKDPAVFDQWIALGAHRKVLGDFTGAAEAWVYAGRLRPADYISLNNLGDLYAYFLKDPVKAESNFLLAIKNGPTQISIYRSVYEFYRNVLRNDAKAKAILQQGIGANPNTSTDLKYLLDHYES